MGFRKLAIQLIAVLASTVAALVIGTLTLFVMALFGVILRIPFDRFGGGVWVAPIAIVTISLFAFITCLYALLRRTTEKSISPPKPDPWSVGIWWGPIRSDAVARSITSTVGLSSLLVGLAGALGLLLSIGSLAQSVGSMVFVGMLAVFGGLLLARRGRVVAAVLLIYWLIFVTLMFFVWVTGASPAPDTISAYGAATAFTPIVWSSARAFQAAVFLHRRRASAADESVAEVFS
jgi:hypothetical protein